MRESVIFDMDGILFDSERVFAEAWHLVGAQMHLPEIRDCVTQCVGRNGRDTRAFLLGKYGPAFPYEQFIGDIKQAFEDIVTTEGGLKLKTGVRELLSWLSDTGVKLGLATSTSRKSAAQHLENAGLLHYFEAVVTGDMIQNGKPDPEIYRLACATLGVPAKNCFAIEDSPNGINSAHAAGLKVIMVPDQIQPTPEIEILIFQRFGSLLDVMAYFESMN